MITNIINTLSIQDFIIIKDDKFHLNMNFNGENKALGTFTSYNEAKWVAALMTRYYILAQLASRRTHKREQSPGKQCKMVK